MFWFFAKMGFQILRLALKENKTWETPFNDITNVDIA